MVAAERWTDLRELPARLFQAIQVPVARAMTTAREQTAVLKVF
jgi:hypothetical protein